MYWIPVILILPYFFLLMKIYMDLLTIRPYSSKSVVSVYVSVVVACRNEEARLPALLDSISGQDYSKELFEVIIVDDNSEDKTFETALENKGSMRLFALKNRGKGKKEALKTGIDASSGRLIITTDADCITGKSWIRTIASFFDENGPDMIIGPVKLTANGKLFGKFQELEYLGLQGITAGTAATGNAIMCNGANLAFTREAYFKQLDNMHFDMPSGDDIFLLHSIKRATDSKILWLESSDAIISTPASPSFGSFLKQRKRWISKWRHYNDRYTNLTGIITFLAVMLQMSVLIALLTDLAYIWLFSAVFILKSVPDYLITRKTMVRFGEKTTMCWFLPVQLIYPVYVIVVFLATLIPWPWNKD
jgi:biofilm PGA synthesis N-glycosyltransferase PgaC